MGRCLNAITVGCRQMSLKAGGTLALAKATTCPSGAACCAAHGLRRHAQPHAPAPANVVAPGRPLVWRLKPCISLLLTRPPALPPCTPAAAPLCSTLNNTYCLHCIGLTAVKSVLCVASGQACVDVYKVSAACTSSCTQLAWLMHTFLRVTPTPPTRSTAAAGCAHILPALCRHGAYRRPATW